MSTFCGKCGAPVDGEDAPVEWRGVRLHKDAGVAFYNDRCVVLGPKGIEVLALLMKRERVSRETLLAIVFPEAESMTVGPAVRLLRKRMEQLKAPFKIETLPYFGYRLVPRER